MPPPTERQHRDAVRRAEERTAAYRGRHASWLVSLGMVRREGAGFRVRDICARLRRPSYRVWRDRSGRARCECEDFAASDQEPPRDCAHITAARLLTSAEKYRSLRALLSDAAARSAERAASRTQPRAQRLPRKPELLAERCSLTAVTDALDAVAPAWRHQVLLVARHGPRRVKVVVAITTGNITRLGTGWGNLDTPYGVQKAEDDATKHAAVRIRPVALALRESGGRPRAPRPARPTRNSNRPERNR